MAVLGQMSKTEGEDRPQNRQSKRKRANDHSRLHDGVVLQVGAGMITQRLLVVAARAPRRSPYPNNERAPSIFVAVAQNEQIYRSVQPYAKVGYAVRTLQATCRIDYCVKRRLLTLTKVVNNAHCQDDDG
jgi:hypothetical protein